MEKWSCSYKIADIPNVVCCDSELHKRCGVQKGKTIKVTPKERLRGGSSDHLDDDGDGKRLREKEYMPALYDAVQRVDVS